MRFFSLKPFWCTTTVALFCSLSLFALPQDAKILSGQADLRSLSSDQLQITTGDQTIIHWKDFSIAKGERLHFLQPSSKSAILNCVKGGDISSLSGHLLANGKVYLINPNGVIIGKDACIQTADFLASTLDLSEEAFLLGRELLFQGDSKEAIINYGTIQALDGNITLIGRVLDNQGSLSAPHGRVSLGAGQEILLKPQDSSLLTIRPQLDESDGTITHTGYIEALLADLQAEGRAHAYGINIQGSVLALNTVESEGKIYLKAGSIAIAPDGILQAPQGSISMEATAGMLYNEGTIQAEQGALRISPKTLLHNLGTLDVSGSQGGEIHIDTPACINSGHILANGTPGSGGVIAIHTHGPYVETSQGLLATIGQQNGGRISLFADTTLFSSGTHLSQGERGGEILLLSPQLTLVSAQIDTSGTSQGGSIFIGGGAHGDLKGPFNATTTHLLGDTCLSANAMGQGNGGTLVVWSEDRTLCYGSMEANAGARGGDGGWIEVSSKQALHCNAMIHAQAPNGTPGTVLFDPRNIIIDAVTGIFPQYPFVDPFEGSGSGFGNTVLPLSTGNVVITKPGDNTGGSGAGAVYLYNAKSAALISTLIGSSNGDAIGENGVTALTGNGNYVISSVFWNGDVGAATWGSGLNGVQGVVSESNSLVGSSSFDLFNLVIVPLNNGNYLALNESWNSGVQTQAGAVTFGDGTTGVSGSISAANSVLGDTMDDFVGATIFYLSNGNYLIQTPTWRNNTGAVTWGSGTQGSHGVISSANSVIGSTPGDLIGNMVQELPVNKNYVISSWHWNGNFGAITWGNGTSGTFGLVGSGNSLIGSSNQDAIGVNGVFLLTNGNYIANNYQSSPLGVNSAGSQTFANGMTGISGTIDQTNSLIGSLPFDTVGVGDGALVNGITELANGNYVVNSSRWNGAANGFGAVTWGSGTTGVHGSVGVGNSLIGSLPNDHVGSSGITALNNGNYVVNSPAWTNTSPAAPTAGAVTLGNGTNGTFGAVSSGNSLVGSNNSDQVGSSGITQLSNGNYVVQSPQWNGGMGALTWGSDIAGVQGAVSSTNSNVGSTAGDNIGNNLLLLTKGNFVHFSPTWTNSATLASSAGAVTWGSSSASTQGVVSNSNSLVGTTASDSVGGAVTALNNGNYVVSSPNWNGNGLGSMTGAVTWASGSGGPTTVGDVSSSNSLVGSTNSDLVGSSGITQLTNSHYIVGSSQWHNAGQPAGAATWGSGTARVTGAVTSANSIVGSSVGDGVGGSVVTLTNGNFVLISSAWTNPDTSAADAGAVTWGSGLGGTTGAVSSSNSLVGSSASDQIGSNGVTELGNGNYVVKSSNWNSSVGAVSWGSGTYPVSGVVGPSNSIVGSTSGDNIGSIVDLVGSDGSNFVVVSPFWRNTNGPHPNAGSVTWGSGLGGTVGVISDTISLVGIVNGDLIGLNGVTVLSNGNYVVLSPNWKPMVGTTVGAVTWGSGASGVVGAVSSTNSLVGSTAGDGVGSISSVNGVFELGTSGNFIVCTSTWHNGSKANAGAVTWGNGNQGGPVGAVGTANSIVGTVANGQLNFTVIDVADGIFMVPFVAGGSGAVGSENSGQVIAGNVFPNQLNYSTVPSTDMFIAPTFIEQTLSAGTAVVLQANNDILLSSPLSSSGTVSLTFSAGRSVTLGADLTTGSGSLTVSANVPLSSGVIDADRAPGDAFLTIGDNVTVNTGTGNLTLALQDGAGKTYSSSGDLTIGSGATLQASGPGVISITAQENNIVLGANSQIQTQDGTLQLSAGFEIEATGPVTFQTSGVGELILICDALFPTSPLFGNGFVDLPQATLSTMGGKLLVYTSQRPLNTLPASINNVPYVPGPEFVDSTTEKWGVYSPNSSGIPFTIFYKNTKPPSPSPSPSPSHFFVSARDAHAAIIAAVEPFQFWMNPWYSDTFFAANIYPPYLTPTIRRLVLPSLMP